MFWFGRRSYLRWIAAGTLIIGAGLIEFWPTGQAPYPFAAADVAAGDPIAVEWRRLPAGSYPAPDLTGMVAAHALTAGDPIGRSDVTVPLGVPDGWWALALEVPARLAPGTATRLVLADGSGPPVPGIVITSDEADRFSATAPTALVAVPDEHVAAVAVAAAARRVVVLIAP